MNKIIFAASLLLAAMFAWIAYSQTTTPHCDYVIQGVSGTFCKKQDAVRGVYYTNGKIDVKIL